MGGRAVSRCGYRPERGDDRHAAGNRVRRRLHHPSIRGTAMRCRRARPGTAAAAETLDRRLPERLGRRRAPWSDRRRRRFDRCRGGRRLGATASRPGGGRVGRVAGVDRSARRCSRRHRGTALRATVAPRRSGRDDGANASVQPAVAGRGADPVVAEPVAAATRRHGRSSDLRCAHPRAAAAAGGADGRRRRHRRPDSPARNRAGMGDRRTTRSVAHGDAGSDRRRSRGPGRRLPGGAGSVALCRASRRWCCATAASPIRRHCGARSARMARLPPRR